MINVTKAAASEIKRLRLRRQKVEARLRLGVKVGGCADLYYTLDLDENVKPSDRVYDSEGISILIGEESCEYITGLTLDYSEDLMGGGFRFHNPNAIESCGCGNSFRVQA